MKVLVTGATGFLGKSVVSHAVEAGHDVVALIRPCSSLPDDGTFSSARQIRGDLRRSGTWQAELESVDTVIHCAAATSGDIAEQLIGSLVATENLLNAVPESLERFVHISSFSVYDYSSPGLFGKLDEETPLEAQPLKRDAYTFAKLAQERLVSTHCEMHAIPLAIARPGAIDGPGKDWDHGRALKLGHLDLIFAPFTKMRLVEVEACAKAIVAMLDLPAERVEVRNLLDQKQPTYLQFYLRARRNGAKLGIPVPVPYFMVRLLGGLARMASLVFFKGNARLPEWLDGRRQQARWRPLRCRSVAID